MLEAHIVSPHGSLSYAGEAEPYDLEMLWEHVRDATAESAGDDVTLEVVVHDAGIDPGVAAWIRRVGRAGIAVRLVFSRALGGRDDESLAEPGEDRVRSAP
ncbi:MAG: hypothetical protein IT294_08835 [Deltaproteobacteria bacterium]|nr:hypothetical protein [Deltaproteobacteria bacterium]